MSAGGGRTGLGGRWRTRAAAASGRAGGLVPEVALPQQISCIRPPMTRTMQLSRGDIDVLVQAKTEVQPSETALYNVDQVVSQVVSPEECDRS